MTLPSEDTPKSRNISQEHVLTDPPVSVQIETSVQNNVLIDPTEQIEFPFQNNIWIDPTLQIEPSVETSLQHDESFVPVQEPQIPQDCSPSGAWEHPAFDEEFMFDSNLPQFPTLLVPSLESLTLDEASSSSQGSVPRPKFRLRPRPLTKM